MNTRARAAQSRPAPTWDSSRPGGHPGMALSIGVILLDTQCCPASEYSRQVGSLVTG